VDYFWERLLLAIILHIIKVRIVEILAVTFSDLRLRNMEAISDAIKDGYIVIRVLLRTVSNVEHESLGLNSHNCIIWHDMSILHSSFAQLPALARILYFFASN
jgi:hypothetical protein